ncbi:pyridoxine 5'-phosphate synthase [Fulvivirgaceae bacterium BMA12]|uniref:Pyridoxine 5'-phosphate synthase n=1 Tax=Agaribacillus aureus TaxID=3051825 RepID=A0ABT8LDA1_9BACT|nr:pyridoxine 5'-phosphate synthase [Fulvivirgaceae bacterium BMA12]
MTKLSVNVNKFATLRNARGGNNPDLIKVVKDCESFGAQGITVHPRPDERHIRYQDVLDIHEVVSTEFNIEGYPDERYMQLVASVKPTQATLVPDGPDVLTSNAGWDTVKNAGLLKEITDELKKCGARVSIFVDPDVAQVEGVAEIGADRIELYTEPYAANFKAGREVAIAPYVKAALRAEALGIEVNAGHDLDLDNLFYLKERIPFLAEVSIGHALVCDALYYGLDNTIPMYLRELNK